MIILKKRFPLLVMMLISWQIMIGQTFLLKGTVKDDSFNDPLIGVNIGVKGKTDGTISDIDGNFSINVSKGDILTISYIGYITNEISIDSQKFLDVILKENIEKLEEVVVVGYGIQKKASSVGSITQAKGEDLMKTGSVTTVSQALQGILPGVVSLSSSSKPGADAADIFIRGKASWVSSSPLTLVDGVERNFNDIDPNEIESLSVLKDASATAVYGVKGANGVILITTKRGSNNKPSINVTTNFGFKQPTTKPEYADYVTTLNKWNEACANDANWDAMIPGSTISAWENAFATGNYGAFNDYFPEIDWWDQMIKDVGFQQQYNINVSGGTDFMRYFTSLGYLNDGDIFETQKNNMYDPSFYYKRYNWRSNFDFNLTKTTILSVNLSGKQGIRNQTGYRINDDADNDTAFGQERFFQRLYSSPRHSFPIQWSDGSYGVSSSGGGNLVMDFDKGSRTYKYFQNFIDVALKQDLDFITKGLSANLKFAYNAESNTQSRVQKYKGGNFAEDKYIGWYRAYDYSQQLPNGSFPIIDGTEKRWANDSFQGDSQFASYDNVLAGGYGKRMYYEFALNYARSFGNNNISGLLLMNRNEVEGLKGGSNVKLKFKENDESWVTRITYNWKERYLSEFNGAYTGSQKFARGKRYKFFPSYSLGWRISEEPIIKNSIGFLLTNLKARYSYGIVGYDRSASPYTYVQTYSSGGDISLGTNGITNFGPLFTEGKAANSNATWETATKQNLGIDMTLADNFTATIDIYKENREGILMTVATPAWFGISEPDGNIGRTKSRGCEFELAWNDKIGKNFKYWIKGNYSYSENRITYRNDPRNLADYLKKAGKPIGVSNKLIVAGYYQSLDDIFNYSTPNSIAIQGQVRPGDFMYVDFNADGQIQDATDMVPMKYLNYPSTTFGGTLGFSFKGFEFNAMLYGVTGVYKEVDKTALWDFLDGASGNYYANPNVVDCWTPNNQASAVKPVLHSSTTVRGYSMRNGTTYSYQNASYIRLKNVEISYLINPKITKKAGLQKLQVYVNGNNLLTFTKFNKQLDPESNSSSLYPLVRRYNVGARLSF